jgi:hypothetical protein
MKKNKSTINCSRRPPYGKMLKTVTTIHQSESEEIEGKKVKLSSKYHLPNNFSSNFVSLLV